MGERKGKEESTKTRRNGGYKQGKSGPVGITMFAAASGSSRISMAKGMNMQNDQRLHQEVIYIYIYI